MGDIAATEQVVVALLLVASLVAIAASYLRQPYTLALVIAGLALSLGGTVTELTLTRDLILLLFLPPLLFEGSINMDLEDLRRRAGQVATLAIPGTAVTVVVLALLFRVIGLEWIDSAVLAVILAPTDPVSVLAIFKEHGVGAGLRTLMEGESIFNDALAIVLYVITVELLEGREISVGEGVFEFGAEVVIGVAVGAVVGLIAHRLMRSIEDHLVEITISIIAAFGPYLVADRLGGSGVIATVTAGLLIGNYGTALAMSPSSRVSLLDFWEVAAFVANSLLFLLMALQFDIATLFTPRILLGITVGFAGIMAARAVIAYGLLAPFRGNRPLAIPPAWQHAVWWGGLRGAIPIALVLGLPERRLGDLDAVSVVFGVVILSLLGQGLTYRRLLDRLGITGVGEEITAYEKAFARTLVLRASLQELDKLHTRGDVIEPVWTRIRHDIMEDLTQADADLAQMGSDSQVVQARQVQSTARRLASAQQSALNSATRRGQLSRAVATEYTERIDEALREGATSVQGVTDVGLYVEVDDDPDTDLP